MSVMTGKIKLEEYFAVLNTKDESLEITKFFEVAKNEEYVFKQIESILVRLFSRLRDSKIKTSFNHKKTKRMIGIGKTDRVVEVDYDKAKKLMKLIHYGLSRGHCLNEKKLSYFAPTQTICSGEISIDEL